MNWDMHWLTTAFDGFVAFLPSLIAGLAVALIGYIIAKVLARVTRSLLRRVGLDRFMVRAGIAGRMGVDEERPASHWAGTAVFVMVIIATLMQVAKTWNMTFVAVGFARLLAYVPHLVGAVLIFGAALFLGNWVRDRLMRSSFVSGQASSQDVRLIPSVARGIIIGIGSFMALRELQIAPEIVNLAFSLSLGAFALAAALAFGLGGRDVAGRLAQSWYERSRNRSGAGAE
jgi:Conserved TM helix